MFSNFDLIRSPETCPPSSSYLSCNCSSSAAMASSYDRGPNPLVKVGLVAGMEVTRGCSPTTWCSDNSLDKTMGWSSLWRYLFYTTLTNNLLPYTFQPTYWKAYPWDYLIGLQSVIKFLPSFHAMLKQKILFVDFFKSLLTISKSYKLLWWKLKLKTQPLDNIYETINVLQFLSTYKWTISS